MSVSGVTGDLGNFPAMNNSFSFDEMNKCARDLAKSWSSRPRRKRLVFIPEALWFLFYCN